MSGSIVYATEKAKERMNKLTLTREEIQAFAMQLRYSLKMFGSYSDIAALAVTNHRAAKLRYVLALTEDSETCAKVLQVLYDSSVFNTQALKLSTLFGVEIAGTYTTQERDDILRAVGAMLSTFLLRQRSE